MEQEAKNPESKWLFPKENPLVYSKQAETIDIHDKSTLCYCDKMQGQSEHKTNFKDDHLVTPSPAFDFILMVMSVSASILMLLACYVMRGTMMYSDDEFEQKNLVYEIQPSDIPVGTRQTFFVAFCFSIIGNFFTIYGNENEKKCRALKSAFSICSGVIALLGIYSVMKLYHENILFIPNSKALSLAWLSCMMNLCSGLVEFMNIYFGGETIDEKSSVVESGMNKTSKLDLNDFLD
ncbi:uncharacterized protein [Clytia hemisphaerica]|uniref:Uncharacterized protein n=1 Tax=Clytia hemisphaerica TaxID=252671 RepID=A0A7M5X255_9CNID|eukprot:TCONS_00058431-protein